MTDTTYLPLPPSVTIKRSDIHGLGLWAVEDIKKGTEIGMSHFYWGEDIQRTPLGAFYNHSDSPNIHKSRRDSRYFMVASKDILSGEELTCTYTFYKCD